MGRYAVDHGVTRASRYFSKKFGTEISKSTIQTMKNTYMEEFKQRLDDDDSENDQIVAALPHKTSALKCVSLAAQKLRRMFVITPDDRKSEKKNAILNRITINNPKVITSQPAKYL